MVRNLTNKLGFWLILIIRLEGYFFVTRDQPSSIIKSFLAWVEKKWLHDDRKFIFYATNIAS